MNRRKVIALMMGNAGLRYDYQGQVRAGVEKVCIDANIDLWVYAGRSDWGRCGTAQCFVYDLVASNRVDGIVLLSSVIEGFHDLRLLYSRLCRLQSIPLCSIGLRLDGVPSIIVDNADGMKCVVNHLARQHGVRRFAFMSGPKGHAECEERLGATREALQGCGIALPDEAIAYGNFSTESGISGTHELLNRLGTFDAVVAANDDMALGVVEALRRRGLRCPLDVRVTGFDDAPSSRIGTPLLTTVRQPVQQLGVRAAESILAAWRGESRPMLSKVPTQAVLRESCGCDLKLVSTGSVPTLGEHDVVPQLESLLGNVMRDTPRCAVLANDLVRSVESAALGQPHALQLSLQRLLNEACDAASEFTYLLPVVACLRTYQRAAFATADLQEIFDDTFVKISRNLHSREMCRHIQEAYLMEEMRISWERLATSLSLDSLRDVLLQDLPRFGIQNAIVSIFPIDKPDVMVPLACLIDGCPVATMSTGFAAEQLKPDDVPQPEKRGSYAILPLTFEWEALGVAVIELPVHEAYQILREQIGSAIKTVRLHETLLRQQERLKIQAQDENRATAERLRLMGIIAGGVAHDLNNALGPLVALPEAIRRDLTAGGGIPTEAIVADLETLQEAAQHAAHTIRDLLTLGRSVDMPKRYEDLNRIMTRSRRAFAQLTERREGVQLRVVLSEETKLVVHISSEHLVRAISNLVANATDAMSGPGEVMIRVYDQTLSDTLDGFEPVAPGHYAVIEVQDWGCGIPQADVSRVLEPFFSNKSQTSQGGTGLGLAIVHQVVSQSQGTIQIRSQLGVGTTIAIYLPLMDHASLSSQAPKHSPVGGNEAILVVDDDQFQLRTARRILGQLGYRISTAPSCECAIQLFSERLRQQPFDLVIVDMQLSSSRDGLATLGQIRSLSPTQKAILASGYQPDYTIIKAAEHGARFLQKPYTATDLANIVRSALDDTSEHR